MHESKKKLFRRLCPLVIWLLGSSAMWAQTPAPNQNELIERLLQRVDQLEKRVAELESGRPVAQAVEPPRAEVPAQPGPVSSVLTPNQPPPGPGAHDHEHGGTALEPASTYPSLRLSGFGDINFTASQQPGSKSGFNEGQLVPHISSALSSRVTYFAELSITARTDAGTGTPPAAGFNLEVERNFIRFDQSDYFKISFGRFHTPISYWNTTFHHGSWLQTAAQRPVSIEFGGSFMPIHFLGALGEGAVPAGGLNLNYYAGIGNGRSSVLSRAGDFGAVNNAKAWLAGGFLKPDWAYGLQVGASIYKDKIDAIGKPEAREWIQSAHIVWTRENPEFIAEFFNINHAAPGVGFNTSSQAWYAQVGWRLSFADRWKPYYRYEHVHIPQADPVFHGTVASFYGSTVGVRYDISSYAAFKLEYRNQSLFGVKNFNSVWAQTDFTF